MARGKEAVSRYSHSGCIRPSRVDKAPVTAIHVVLLTRQRDRCTIQDDEIKRALAAVRDCSRQPNGPRSG